MSLRLFLTSESLKRWSGTFQGRFAVPAAEVEYANADFLSRGRHRSSHQTAFVEFKLPAGTLHVYAHGESNAVVFLP